MNSARQILFSKCHGFGNDFILVEERELAGLTLSYSGLAMQICARKFSVGGDGLIIWSTLPGNGDFTARIFNADGSEAESSGNGIRCLGAALFHADPGLADTVHIRTLGGPKAISRLAVENNLYTFRTNLGPPEFDPARIPFLPVTGDADGRLEHMLPVGDRRFRITPVSLGNPHCVIRTDAIDFDLLYGAGPSLESHPQFPARANVEFVRVVDRGAIEIAIWERGVGHTLSSGTGSAAAAVASIANGWTDGVVLVQMEGGETLVRWERGGDVIQDGKAQFVYSGRIESHALRF
jgi:diaminopimelate epimerase